MQYLTVIRQNVYSKTALREKFTTQRFLIQIRTTETKPNPNPNPNPINPYPTEPYHLTVYMVLGGELLPQRCKKEEFQPMGDSIFLKQTLCRVTKSTTSQSLSRQPLINVAHYRASSSIRGSKPDSKGSSAQ